jgi:SH3-like domain-containing protein
VKRRRIYRNLLVTICFIATVSCSTSTNEKIEARVNKSVDWIGQQFSSLFDDDVQEKPSASIEQTATTNKVPKARLENIPPLETIGASYRILKDANVRGGPGTDFVVVDIIRQDAVVMVIGKVKNKSWYLIGDGDNTNGYVYETLLKAVPITERENLPVDKISSESMVVQEEDVDTERLCKTVRQKITIADGSTREEDVTACQGPNGWEIQ